MLRPQHAQEVMLVEILIEKEWTTYRPLTTGLLMERREGGGGRGEGGRHGENRKCNEQWKGNATNKKQNKKEKWLIRRREM